MQDWKACALFVTSVSNLTFSDWWKYFPESKGFSTLSNSCPEVTRALCMATGVGDIITEGHTVDL